MFLRSEAKSKSISTAVNLDYPHVDHVQVADLISLRPKGENLGRQNSKILAQQSGAYQATFRGRGMEFAESRIYQAGDDVRHLDWRVTARTGEAHTKLFHEERQRPVFFCVDFRRHMFFATQVAFKSVVAANAVSLLAWNALKHGDRIGGFLFSESQHQELKPQTGTRAVLRLLHGLESYSQQQNQGQLDAGLSPSIMRLRQVVRPGSLIYFLSDFRGLDAQAETQLISLSRHNNIVAFFFHDPLEAELPPPGVYQVSDGKQNLSFNSANSQTRDQYRSQFMQRQQALEKTCRRGNILFVPCATTADLPMLMQQYLKLH